MESKLCKVNKAENTQHICYQYSLIYMDQKGSLSHSMFEFTF